MEETPINSAETDDQDSAWKDMLDACLPDFLAFFFPHLESAVDWTRRYESLDTELARLKPDLPGGKLFADKLYQVWLKNRQAKWILIHIEVQGRAQRGFARRVFDYNYRISAKHPGVDVVSLAVITETKRLVKGRYERAAFGCSLVFEFPLAQLATYADRLEELSIHPNPFALAVAVQLKALETRGDNQSRSEWKRAFIVGLYRRGFPRGKIIALLRFMDEAMRLPAALEEIIQETIHRIEEGTKMPYVTSWEKMALEQGVQQGTQQGLQQGLLEAVSLQLAHRLGDLKQATQTKLRKLSLEQLQALLVALLDFQQQADLQVWLKAQSLSVTKPVQKTNRKHAK